MPKAELTFSGKLKSSHRSAIRKAREGLGDVLPVGFNKLSIRINKKTKSYAYTRESSVPGRMVIKFNPKKHKSRDENRRIGKLTQTISHEMYVHARNDLTLLSQSQPTLKAKVEHNRMHDPLHRQGFLDMSRRTFDQLENNTQKRAFAESWFRDMKNEIGSSGLPKDQRRERKTWALERQNSMVHAIDHRGEHNW